jgi:hypothetical protein
VWFCRNVQVLVRIHGSDEVVVVAVVIVLPPGSLSQVGRMGKGSLTPSTFDVSALPHPPHYQQNAMTDNREADDGQERYNLRVWDFGSELQRHPGAETHVGKEAAVEVVAAGD